MGDAMTLAAPARLTGTLLAVTLGLSLPCAPAAAGTASHGPLSITAEDQYLQRNCVDYPVAFSVTPTSPTEWELELDVQDLTGRSQDSDWTYGTGQKFGSLEANLCDNLNGAGTYNLVATLTARDPETYQVTGTYTASTQMVLSRAPSEVTAKLSTGTARRGGSVVASGKVQAAAGPYAGRGVGDVQVTVRSRIKGTSRWRTHTTVTTDQYGRYRVKLPVGQTRRTVYVRTSWRGDSVLSRATSAVRTLRIV